jgi:hypothetical protein
MTRAMFGVPQPGFNSFAKESKYGTRDSQEMGGVMENVAETQDFIGNNGRAMGHLYKCVCFYCFV